MIEAAYQKHTLDFLFPAGTSRGVLHTKDSWFLIIRDWDDNERSGIGECSIIPGLSPDPVDEIPGKLERVCSELEQGESIEELELEGFPAIRFAVETALADLEKGGRRILHDSDFTSGNRGIPINGLIWMGQKEEMLKRVSDKIEDGYKVLKLKVGAIDLDEEMDIIRHIRSAFSINDLEIRLDANGAWEAEEAREILNMLSEFDIHSIEQPIKAGQWEHMAELCETSPIPIALDEELIGIEDSATQQMLLKQTRPAYIILKPSLLGGTSASRSWIEMAEKLGIGWWVTSALESNVGLNAIAQWTATLETEMPQGLGTGQLFSNNIPSPLAIRNGVLYYDTEGNWDTGMIINRN